EQLRQWESGLPGVMLTRGGLWWRVQGGREIDRLLREDAEVARVVALLSLRGLQLGLAARILSWQRSRIDAAALPRRLRVWGVDADVRASRQSGERRQSGAATLCCARQSTRPFDGTGGRSDRALDPTTFACGHRCSLARSTRNSLCRSFDAGVHLGECDRPAH